MIPPVEMEIVPPAPEEIEYIHRTYKSFLPAPTSHSFSTKQTSIFRLLIAPRYTSKRFSKMCFSKTNSHGRDFLCGGAAA
jgi:hypothetical protein